MVYLEVVHVVGIPLVMLILLSYSSWVTYGMEVEQFSVMYLLVLEQKLQNK